MDFALAAIIVFLIALPGVLFRYSYRRLAAGTTVTFKTVVDETALGIIFAIIVHGILIVIIRLLGLRDNIDFRNLILIISGDDSENGRLALSALASNLRHACYYILASSGLGFILGFIAQKTVRIFLLDLYFDRFRFPDPWWYVFRGEEWILHDLRQSYGKAPWRHLRSALKSQIVTHATAVVQQGDKLMLYGGIIVKYYYENGTIDRIVLSGAYRLPLPEKYSDELENIYTGRTLFSDAEQRLRLAELQYFPITSDLLVIDYSDIKTLGLMYYTIGTTGTAGDDDASADSIEVVIAGQQSSSPPQSLAG